MVKKSSHKSTVKLGNLEKALRKLQQFLLVKEPSELERTGIIKAFEYTFELFWKTLKFKGEMEGLQLASPKAAVAFGFQSGVIKNDGIWLDMLEKRNLGAHTYNEDQAKAIYEQIKSSFAAELAASFKTLAEQVAKA